MTRAVARSSACRLAHSRAGWLAGLLALLAVISFPCALLCFLFGFYRWLTIISLLFTAVLLVGSAPGALIFSYIVHFLKSKVNTSRS